MKDSMFYDGDKGAQAIIYFLQDNYSDVVFDEVKKLPENMYELRGLTGPTELKGQSQKESYKLTFAAKMKIISLYDEHKILMRESLNASAKSFDRHKQTVLLLMSIIDFAPVKILYDKYDDGITNSAQIADLETVNYKIAFRLACRYAAYALFTSFVFKIEQFDGEIIKNYSNILGFILKYDYLNSAEYNKSIILKYNETYDKLMELIDSSTWGNYIKKIYHNISSYVVKDISLLRTSLENQLSVLTELFLSVFSITNNTKHVDKLKIQQQLFKKIEKVNQEINFYKEKFACENISENDIEKLKIDGCDELISADEFRCYNIFINNHKISNCYTSAIKKLETSERLELPSTRAEIPSYFETYSKVLYLQLSNREPNSFVPYGLLSDTFYWIDVYNKFLFGLNVEPDQDPWK